jgi:hypothetical protein
VVAGRTAPPSLPGFSSGFFSSGSLTSDRGRTPRPFNLLFLQPLPTGHGSVVAAAPRPQMPQLPAGAWSLLLLAPGCPSCPAELGQRRPKQLSLPSASRFQVMPSSTVSNLNAIDVGSGSGFPSLDRQRRLLLPLLYQWRRARWVGRPQGSISSVALRQLVVRQVRIHQCPLVSQVPHFSKFHSILLLLLDFPS